MINKNYTANEVTATKKLRQEIVVKMNDGDMFLGRILVGFNEVIMDIMNDSRTFISVELDNHRMILLAKNNIVSIDYFQVFSERASNFEKKLEDSVFYNPKSNTTIPPQDTHNTQNNHTQTIEYAPPQRNTPNQEMNAVKCYDEIYERYTYIVKILNNPIFKEKRKIDHEFDTSIHNIINALKATATLLEQSRGAS